VRTVTRARIVSIYATRWRYVGDAGETLARLIDLGELAETYEAMQEQLPRPLVRREPDAVVFGDGSVEIAVDWAGAWLFALPSDQTVAALWFDLDIPGPLAATVDSVLDACIRGEVRIDGLPLSEYALRLKDSTEAAAFLTMEDDEDEPQEVAQEARGEQPPLLPQRHQIVFLPEADGVGPQEIRRILYRRTAPYSNEFVREVPAQGLHEDAKIAMVTPYVSLVGGHDDAVEKSVFLSTVQTVGTAARFRQIWHEAYKRVRQFRREKQKKGVGRQVRDDLQALVDYLGNLEFDLTFSVEFPLMRIESFHTALYEAMDLEKQATTLSQMFQQLAGSIQSELTAIEIRERDRAEDLERVDEIIQRRYERAATLLTVLIIPVGLLLGFLGINAKQVSDDYSFFDLHHYWYAYLTIGLFSAGSSLGVAWLFRRARQMRQKVRRQYDPPR
jgi:hypothetical protein